MLLRICSLFQLGLGMARRLAEVLYLEEFNSYDPWEYGS